MNRKIRGRRLMVEVGDHVVLLPWEATKTRFESTLQAAAAGQSFGVQPYRGECSLAVHPPWAWHPNQPSSTCPTPGNWLLSQTPSSTVQRHTQLQSMVSHTREDPPHACLGLLLFN
jgi:hypothetical protein